MTAFLRRCSRQKGLPIMRSVSVHFGTFGAVAHMGGRDG